MRIAYDHQIFSQQEHGGITRYFLELATRLARTEGVDVRVIAPLYLCPGLGQAGLAVTGRYLPRISRTHRLRQWVNDLISRRVMAREGADILHQTYYTSKPSADVPLVVTVYDMIHERYGQLLPSGEQGIAKAKQACVHRADQVICISQQTKDDLVSMLSVPAERVHVIHLGTSLAGGSGMPATVRNEGPYLLYVGRRQGPKNFNRLLAALAIDDGLLKECSLICFGGGAFTREERELITDLGLPMERIRQEEGDDQTLAVRYANALALVYPSLYEGFGLPLVEAMACGCPVVSSRSGSLPEVAGEAAEYFEPSEAEDIARALLRVVSDSGLRSGLIARGLARAGHFTWDQCAKKTLEVYRLCR